MMGSGFYHQARARLVQCFAQ